MLKKTIKYTDFNGEPRMEDFYFNLTKAEVGEMELKTKGGLVAHLKSVVATEDGETIVNKFKEIILMAYGVKSDDGRRFIKNDQLREEFTQTNAYSELFMELATDVNAAGEFINGIVPQDMAEATTTPGVPQDHKPKNLPVASGNEQAEVAKTNAEGMAEYLAWKAQQTPADNS